MKLYVCYSTGGAQLHPCKVAADALKAAGYDPEVTKVKGFHFLPKRLQTKGRKHVNTLTGNYHVPTLELDNGTIIDGSTTIANWANDNPA